MFLPHSTLDHTLRHVATVPALGGVRPNERADALHKTGGAVARVARVQRTLAPSVIGATADPHGRAEDYALSRQTVLLADPSAQGSIPWRRFPDSGVVSTKGTIMAAVISPAMARHNAKTARRARIAAGRARQLATVEYVVIDADSGDIICDGFEMRLLAERWASDRSHGDRSLVVVSL